MPYKDIEKKRAYDREYSSKVRNSLSRNISVHKYLEAHREELRERSAFYRKNNVEKCRKAVRTWIKKYPYKNAAKEAKRRALKTTAIPLWANLSKIKEIYKLCPSGCHVDHIVPLNGKIVCGLHWEGNLQYLDAQENILKSNNLI